MSAVYYPVQYPVYEYQVSGCLPPNAPTYVERKADNELYNALKRGEFCYILNSRQMGKSSLRVRTMQRLEAEGISCAVVDLTGINSQQITPDQWYAGIIHTLADNFPELDAFDLSTFTQWWRDRTILPPVQRFIEFIHKVLLRNVSQNIVIFIDEIDSVLALKFRVDEFFSAIRWFYEQRAYIPDYKRLTFTFLGVATPSNLIQNPNSAPFNIGQSIELCGFKFQEAQSLIQGLEGKVSTPKSVLREVLNWTGGQPFLTQKLCKLILTYSHSQSSCSLPIEWVAKLVRVHLLENWEATDDPEHLRTIRDRLIKSNQRDRLLKLYQTILQQQEVPAKDTNEEMELRLSGLVVKKDGKLLRVSNRIYKSVFNLHWVEDLLPPPQPPQPPQPLPIPPSIPKDELISLQEHFLYNHLLDCVQREFPPQMIERFRLLFIDGSGYPEREIADALNKITASNLTEQEFNNILNRCFYILINRWQMHPKHQSVIPTLVALFQNYSSSVVQSPSSRRLQNRVQLFTKSEQYLDLVRLTKIFEPNSATNEVQESLADMMKRYPYLYPHCLLRQGSSAEHQKIIQSLQKQKQHQFETHLLRYATYLARRIEIEGYPSPNKATEILQPISNPTRLTDRELLVALKKFVGKVDGSHTYKDLAHLFLAHTCKTPSYRNFKKDLYDYLIDSIKPEYGKHQFNQRLAQHLKNILPDWDSQKVNNALLAQTCRQLFNFLVANPKQREHLLFIDLITNNGSLSTVGLLLKIALLSRQVKPHLEQRFSILFDHYESHNINNNNILWLVESLENLNIALGVNFGAVDLSFISKLAEISDR